MADLLARAMANTKDMIPQQENPRHTRYGQQTVSVADNFWTNLSKEGQMVYGFKSDYAATNTMAGLTVLSSVGAGRKIFVSRIVISATVDVLASVKITGIKHGQQITPGPITIASDYFEHYHIKAFTPLVMPFNGELWMEEGAELQIRSQTIGAGVTGIMACSAMGWEVTYNA